MREDDSYSCSFCGKKQKDAKKLIASPGGDAFICDECVTICKEIMVDEVKTSSEFGKSSSCSTTFLIAQN